MSAKAFFLSEAGSDYGYGLTDQQLTAQRRKEYPSLHNTHYLDYTASPPAPLSTLRTFNKALSATLYSNPHSRSSSSSATDNEINLARGEILQTLFGLRTPTERDNWDVVFTSGATAALKIVADSFPWREGKYRYRYLQYAHTSLIGVRGAAAAGGAEAECVRMKFVDAWPQDDDVATLFGYPAQSNATGEKLGLSLCRAVKSKSPSTLVLLDAAAYVSTSVLDLSSLPLKEAPDFIACSLYKCFGYPTGLGVLVVKRASAGILQRPAFFGGGTVESMSTLKPFFAQGRTFVVDKGYPTIHQRYEDGTLPFLQIIALRHAIVTHTRLYRSHQHVTRHVSAITQYAIRELSNLHHDNGTKVVKLHRVVQAGGHFESSGSTLGFSILTDSGSFVGHVEFDKLATKNGFHVRTGGLCNIGTLMESVGLSNEDIARRFARGGKCGDDEEFDPETNTPYGIIRISFGAASLIDDFLAFMAFLRKDYVSQSTNQPPELSYGPIKPKKTWLKRLSCLGGKNGKAEEATQLGSPVSGSSKSTEKW